MNKLHQAIQGFFKTEDHLKIIFKIEFIWRFGENDLARGMEVSTALDLFSEKKQDEEFKMDYNITINIWEKVYNNN